METPVPLISSHLALLARLDQLYESQVLLPDAQPKNVDHPESELPPAEGDLESGSDAWREVAELVQILGDGLKDDELRVPLGKTSLPELMASILRLALELPDVVGSIEAKAMLPKGVKAEAVVQFCRVAGNLCFECDANRDRLLSQTIPQILLSLVAGLASAPTPEKDDLGLTRSVIGALLNITLGHMPTLTALSSSAYPIENLLTLANTLYLPGNTAEDVELRSSIALWAWKIIGEVSLLEKPVIPLSPSLLPLLLAPILAYDGTRSSAQSATDVQILVLVAQILELAAGESAKWQQALGELNLGGDQPALARILDFILNATVRPSASTGRDDGEDNEEDEEDEEEDTNLDKLLSGVKGKLIKTVVAVSGCDALSDVLFDNGQSWFLHRMEDWLEKAKPSTSTKEGESDKGSREDLLICAVLSIGNLARSEASCVALLAPPSKLLERIVPLLDVKTDVKLQHALVGLLKNLAIPDKNKSLLGDAGIIERIVLEMDCFATRLDRVASVQGGAIGILKHLCKGSVTNSLRLLNPTSKKPTPPVQPMLALLARTDDFPLRAEAARVLVNATRTLYSDVPKNKDIDADIEKARAALTEKEVVNALIGLLRGGVAGKMTVLVVEGVVSLAVLASSSLDGAKIIARSLMHPLLLERTSAPTTDEEATETRTTLTVLGSVLTSPQTAPELKANVCALLGAAGRAAGGGGTEMFIKELEKAKGALGEEGVAKEAEEGALHILQGAIKERQEELEKEKKEDSEGMKE